MQRIAKQFQGKRFSKVITKEGLIMPTLTIQEAQAQLPDLIHHLSLGEEVVITENDQPVVKLVPTRPPAEARRVPNSAR